MSRDDLCIKGINHCDSCFENRLLWTRVENTRSVQYAFSVIQSRDSGDTNQDGESRKIRSDKILYIFCKNR